MKETDAAAENRAVDESNEVARWGGFGIADYQSISNSVGSERLETS